MTPEEGQILFDAIISGCLKAFFYGLVVGAIVKIYKTAEKD